MWKTMKLGDICRIINGGTPKSNVKDYWEGEVQWLTPKDMGKLDGKYVDATERQITVEGLTNSSAKLVPTNSVILSCRAPIGHVFINNVEMSFNQGCKGLIPTDEISVEYLYYFLFSSKHLLNDLGTGTTFKEISGKTLSNVEIPLPPLAEQQRIVAKLDAAFAEIDRAVEIANAKVKEVNFLFKKELKNTFSNGEFESVNLEKLANVTSSKRVLKSHYVESGIPFYRTKEIKELANGNPIRTELFISQEQFSEFKNKFGAPQAGDVLITAIGTIGEVYVVQQGDEFYFKDGNVLWLRNISGLNSDYLRYSLINFTDELNSLAHGAAYSALPIQRLKSHKIPIKTLSEQTSSVVKLDALGKLTQDLDKLNSNKISALGVLKSAILAQELQSEAV